MSAFRDGDWYCSACKNHNFARRNECKQCGTAKDVPKAVSTLTTTAPVHTVIPTYYLAVDIERVGSDFKYGVLAIGACFGTSDGTIIEKRSFCDRVPKQEDFEPECWSQFWSKFVDVLARIDAEAIPNHIVAFHDWLLALEKTYGPFGRKHKSERVFKFISDNPAYDIGMINLEFYRAGLPKPMAEMFSDYVVTDDPSEQVRGLSPNQRAVAQSRVTAKHSHFPSDDAEGIFQLRCGIASLLEN